MREIFSKIGPTNHDHLTIPHGRISSKRGSTTLSQIVDDRYIYETEEEHDHRIERQNRRYQRGKKRSRQEARNAGVRRPVMQRAGQKCEICRLDFWSILVLHHIMPVSLGGLADPSNLIALCPNCHALVHNYSHFKCELTVRQKYPAWKRGLTSARLNEDQAERLLLVASKDARVLPDGSIVPYKKPERPVSIIVNDEGQPVDERHGPAKIETALARIEATFGAEGSTI